MVSEQFPPPDLRALRTAWDDWIGGNVLPGQTLANLKKAGLPQLLAAADAPASAREPWDDWERGRRGPREVLQDLDAAGLGAYVQRRAEEASADSIEG